MNTIVHRPIHAALRPTLGWSDTWQGPDQGLIRCWEAGRERALKHPDIARRCIAGELPVLGWKGGVERTLKKLEKFGSLKYLAHWQGLRGDDLQIDTTAELTISCSRTGMVVTFTPEQSKYYNSQVENEE
ncbi:MULTISPECIES: hypothetical protein [Pseudomonas]|jgi:hypothetical protein|uniref:Uncharacterized protein n=1 Tax=Pseudomonas donghuensis TaxID=1163398 RepID=A0AAP0SHV5_9PSED|nr:MULTISPECIES: hypothetical protein [Pseudomonas]MDF9894352.1 hypothetical protein [Pseudomonas vranovensis]KDN98400.2 hypothetical protein BV82_3774 [Pseudomonas donghuensis]MBS7596802.1 hypothetical protein [Pseudomonas sp. RC2C2]MCP6692250.1 hypothetical protein [Pseudomonas donghuensis]MCP6698179.1 hypothetical protein [Pseudomonas donghuensis]